MNSSKVLLIVGLIAISCVTFSYAIKCYSCNTKDSCKSPKKVECTTSLANQTSTYLDIHHTGVNLNQTSPYLQCFYENIKSNYGDVRYKGCVYSTINACELPLRPAHNSGSVTRSCGKCDNKNYCNPAGRANIGAVVMVAIVLVGLVGRSIWV
ncbi:uncharacterized protein LOC101890994 [Musca domestica]|uniref:Uncharacterized protein LOC101890994 n=1 Tax=Musca domestica TaxID=7370 RepID=A0A1I8MXW5_MUSDO|nr:uncharacterized protein LOC101890994 [Musca domestica]